MVQQRCFSGYKSQICSETISISSQPLLPSLNFFFFLCSIYFGAKHLSYFESDKPDEPNKICLEQIIKILSQYCLLYPKPVFQNLIITRDSVSI